MLLIENRAGSVVAAVRGLRMAEGHTEGAGTPRCKLTTAESGLGSFEVTNVSVLDVLRRAPNLVRLDGAGGFVVGVDPACVVSVSGEDHTVPARRTAWLELRDGGRSFCHVVGVSPSAVVEALSSRRDAPAAAAASNPAGPPVAPGVKPASDPKP